MALAGNPVPVPPDDPAGPPQLREPSGLARVVRDPAAPGFLVADAENHCLWLVSPEGQAAVFCGRPLEPGHQDGAHSRFRRPTYLDVRHWMSRCSPYRTAASMIGRRCWRTPATMCCAGWIPRAG